MEQVRSTDPVKTDINNTVQLLLKMEQTLIYIKKTGANPLFTAWKNVQFSTVQLLHRIGADIYFCEENRTSTFDIAYENGHDSTGQVLRKNK